MIDPRSLALLIGFGGAFFLLGILFLQRASARKRALFHDEVEVVAPPSSYYDFPPAAADGRIFPRDLRQTLPDVPPPPVAVQEPLDEPAVQPQVEVAVPRPVQSADLGLRQGLAQTRSGLVARISGLFGGKSTLSASLLDEMEDILLTADLGVQLATRWMADIRARAQHGNLRAAADVQNVLRNNVLALLAASQNGSHSLGKGDGTRVILFVGVNGVGKTTTIGKIAGRLRAEGCTVALAAGDTFRAAAVEQLSIWGERTDCPVFKGDARADPASVIFNAVKQSVAKAYDFVLADTAGRLHTKQDLMDEILKVRNAAGKALPGAPQDTWLVVDATTGQNALQQAKRFDETIKLTGVILTKLDGTAKGGVVVAIAHALGVPIRFIGVGEKTDDLRPFDSAQFVDAIFD
jgi:fused signal recognition particle receptor